MLFLHFPWQKRYDKHAEPFREPKKAKVVDGTSQKGKIKYLRTQALIKNNKRHVKHAAAKNAGSLFDKKKRG